MRAPECPKLPCEREASEPNDPNERCTSRAAYSDAAEVCPPTGLYDACGINRPFQTMHASYFTYIFDARITDYMETHP